MCKSSVQLLNVTQSYQAFRDCHARNKAPTITVVTMQHSLTMKTDVDIFSNSHLNFILPNVLKKYSMYTLCEKYYFDLLFT